MEIKLKGSEKQLKRFLRSNSTAMKRKSIEVIYNKKIELIKPTQTAADVAELIAACETIEDLKQYESDTRQTAAAAYKKKLKEFE